MYNRKYFEVSNEYKVIGNYCIHRYNKEDLFDNDDVIAVITKYDCNNIVAFIHDDGKIEKYPTFDIGGDRYYIFGNNMLRRIYNASKNDIRANALFDRIDDYFDDYDHCYNEGIYILRYDKNDLLK